MNPHRSRPSARVGVISRKVEAQEVPRIGGGGTSERWPSAKDQDKKLNANAQPDGLPMPLVKSALRYPFLDRADDQALARNLTPSALGTPSQFAPGDTDPSTGPIGVAALWGDGRGDPAPHGHVRVGASIPSAGLARKLWWGLCSPG